MILLEGRPIAEEIKLQLKKEIAASAHKPRLAIVMVGKNPASQKFIALKEMFAREITVQTRRYDFPADIATNELRARMKDIVHEAHNDGVIIQLPLPEHIDTQSILNAVIPEKDVDVLSARAVGDFQVGKEKVMPPVAAAIKLLFEKYGIEVKNKKAVVVGYGKLVGQPVATWLAREGAQVSILQNPEQFDPEILKTADIVISGTSEKNLIRGEHIKEGAVLVDMGDGDVDEEGVSKKAAYVAPARGGVGPLTVAILFQNLFRLYSHK